MTVQRIAKKREKQRRVQTMMAYIRRLLEVLYSELGERQPDESVIRKVVERTFSRADIPFQVWSFRPGFNLALEQAPLRLTLRSDNHATIAATVQRLEVFRVADKAGVGLTVIVEFSSKEKSNFLQGLRQKYSRP